MMNPFALNDPNGWTSDSNWSHFYRKKNVFTLLKHIFNNLLTEVNAEKIDLYRTYGYYFQSSEDLSRLKIFDECNLLESKLFNLSMWIVVDNAKDIYSEKLQVIVNKDLFEIKYIDKEDRHALLSIPYHSEENTNHNEIQLQMNEVKLNHLNKALEQCLMEYMGHIDNEEKKTLEFKINEIKDELSFLINANKIIRLEIDNLIETRNKPIEIQYWIQIIQRIFSAKLPNLNNIQEKTNNFTYHVIDVRFNGENKNVITNLIF